MINKILRNEDINRKKIIKYKKQIMSSNKSKKTEDSELDSSITNQINVINEDNYENNKPLPCNENLLDKYEIIQYKNIKIRRLNFENEYIFDKYKKLFDEIFDKINIDFNLTSNFFQKIRKLSIVKSINFQISNHNIDINNNKDIYQNIQNIDDDNIINSENKKTNSENDKQLDIFINISDLKRIKNDKKQQNYSTNNFKYLKRIFNLRLYDNNQKLICKKRGRKTLIEKDNLHTHSALDNDNILRKIQVHFLTFLVSFTNDYIDSLYPNYAKKSLLHFRHIDYKVKRIINFESIEKMKSQTIGEILQKQASPKNKTCVVNINQLIYSRLCIQCPNLKLNYFNKLFKEFFIEYYYNKSDKNIILNGIKVNLSNKTRAFNSLIQKNIKYIEKFRNIASYFYIKNNEVNDEKENSNNEEDKNDLRQKPFFIID